MNLLSRSVTERPLPLWRRPLIIVALVLGIWAPFKVAWEKHIDEEIMQVRYQGAELNRDLRDQLSQNAMIGLLGGFRGVIADLIWLAVTDAWTEQDWYAAEKNIELATTLQPRFIPFWELGGWHLAWNASVDVRNDPLEPDQEERKRREQFWIQRGKKIFERGLEANPETFTMYRQLADLYDQKLQDPARAADYYLLASQSPDSPLFLERFPGYKWEEAGMDERAYEHWKMLWNKHLGSPDEPRIAKDKIEEHVRKLEKKLNVPVEKRIFPKPSSSPSLKP